MMECVLAGALAVGSQEGVISYERGIPAAGTEEDLLDGDARLPRLLLVHNREA